MFTFTYIAWAVYWLVFPERLLVAGNRLWLRYRLMNVLFLLLQVLYQIPDIEGPTGCAQAASCMTWQTFFGFQKVFVVRLPNSPQCNYLYTPFSSDNSTCPSAFNVIGGLGMHVLIFALCAFQARVYASQAFSNWRDNEAVERNLSAWRASRDHRLRAVTKAKRVVELQRQYMVRRKRMLHLVAKAEQWFAMLEAGAAASSGRRCVCCRDCVCVVL